MSVCSPLRDAQHSACDGAGGVLLLGSHQDRLHVARMRGTSLRVLFCLVPGLGTPGFRSLWAEAARGPRNRHLASQTEPGSRSLHAGRAAVLRLRRHPQAARARFKRLKAGDVPGALAGLRSPSAVGNTRRRHCPGRGSRVPTSLRTGGRGCPVRGCRWPRWCRRSFARATVLPAELRAGGCP